MKLSLLRERYSVAIVSFILLSSLIAKPVFAFQDDPAGVTATNSGPLTCNITSATLTGSSTTSGATFSWAGTGAVASFRATGSTAVVTAPGTYILTATDPATGSTATALTTVVQTLTVPTGVTASHLGELTCTGNIVYLSGSSTSNGVTYAWTGPDGFSATGATTTASIAGTYTFIATYTPTGCTATANATVSRIYTAPGDVTATASNSLTCSNSNVTLTGASNVSGATYTWAGPNGFTASGATVTTTTAGTYTLTAANGSSTFGCTSTASVAVVQDLAAPAGVAATTSGALNCTNTSVTLTGTSTSGATYTWTGPGGFTASGASATTATPGTYMVTATDPSSGCMASASTTVSQNNTTPTGVTATASGALTCTNTSVALTGASSDNAATFTWTGPGGFTASSASAAATSPGTYTLTAIDPGSGCSATASATVTQNSTAPALAIASATGTTTINCTNSTLSLTGNANPQNVTYSWTGPNSYSSTNATTSVTMPGTYTVTATETDNGCTKTANVVIGLDTASPSSVTTSSVPANAVLTCSNPNVVLTGNSATSGVTYLWTGPGGFSSTGAVATATTTGSYTLTVTNPGNGCSAAGIATIVTQNIVTPVGVTANVANKITCTTPTTTITGNSSTSGATFAWSGPGGFTSSAGSATASMGGVYTLTVTNPTDGCTASKTLTVVADTATPTGVTATNSGELNCTVTTVTLTGNSTTSGATYIWTGPDGYFDPEQISSMATDSGTYVLTVTNPENGCSAEATTYVAMDLSACTAVKPRITGGKANGFDDSTLAAAFTYKLYPNPVSTTTATIEFTAPVAAQLIVEIYNNTGAPERVLFNNSVEANQSYRLTLNPSGLAAGIHYCLFRVNGKVFTSKLLILP